MQIVISEKDGSQNRQDIDIYNKVFSNDTFSNQFD